MVGLPRLGGAAADLKRKFGGDGLAHTLGPGVLRLALGRWPTGEEVDAFRRGMREPFVALPPLIRGLMVVGDVRDAMHRVTSLARYHRRLRGCEDPFGDRVFPGGVTPVPDLSGNLFTAWTGPKLAFMHLEKCGGIALMRWLSEQFHPDQIDPDPLRAAPPHNFYRAPPGIGRECARYPLLWGHFGLPAIERIDPDRFVLTLLREPKARLVSIYHYWRAVNPAQIDDLEHDPIVGSAQRNDLLGFLRDPEPLLRDYLDNFYVRRLTGHHLTGAACDRLADDPQGALAEAMAALESIGFVGITERMDESAARLAALIGAEPPTASLRGNVAAENHTDPSGWFRKTEWTVPTPEIEAELDRLTRLDRLLYATARARFEDMRVEKMPIGGAAAAVFAAA